MDCRPRKSSNQILRNFILLIAGVVISVSATLAYAWDHPSHMITSAIAFAEIEQARPELIEKIGLLLMTHPDPSPFWVAAGDATGKERARLMFIEAARWPDDARWTIHDRPTWHSARWAIIADDASPEAKAAAEALNGKPKGHAIEALVLNFGVLSSSESSPTERAAALSWFLHLLGDIHQPLHVSEYYSKKFPEGNGAGALEYVEDPLGDSGMPLHLLLDSNSLRKTELGEVDRNARELVQKYPRSSFSELANFKGADDFEKWARESYQVAVDFVYGSGIETVADPDMDKDKDTAVKKMVAYILDGISPVKEAPKVPKEYWEQLQIMTHRRVILAGYRIADCILAAADQLASERAFTGKVLGAVDNK